MEREALLADVDSALRSKLLKNGEIGSWQFAVRKEIEALRQVVSTEQGFAAFIGWLERKEQLYMGLAELLSETGMAPERGTDVITDLKALSWDGRAGKYLEMLSGEGDGNSESEQFMKWYTRRADVLSGMSTRIAGLKNEVSYLSEVNEQLVSFLIEQGYCIEIIPHNGTPIVSITHVADVDSKAGGEEMPPAIWVEPKVIVEDQLVVTVPEEPGEQTGVISTVEMIGWYPTTFIQKARCAFGLDVMPDPGEIADGAEGAERDAHSMATLAYGKWYNSMGRRLNKLWGKIYDIKEAVVEGMKKCDRAKEVLKADIKKAVGGAIDRCRWSNLSGGIKASILTAGATGVVVAAVAAVAALVMMSPWGNKAIEKAKGGAEQEALRVLNKPVAAVVESGGSQVQEEQEEEPSAGTPPKPSAPLYNLEKEMSNAVPSGITLEDKNAGPEFRRLYKSADKMSDGRVKFATLAYLSGQIAGNQEAAATRMSRELAIDILTASINAGAGFAGSSESAVEREEGINVAREASAALGRLDGSFGGKSPTKGQRTSLEEARTLLKKIADAPQDAGAAQDMRGETAPVGTPDTEGAPSPMPGSPTVDTDSGAPALPVARVGTEEPANENLLAESDGYIYDETVQKVFDKYGLEMELDVGDPKKLFREARGIGKLERFIVLNHVAKKIIDDPGLLVSRTVGWDIILSAIEAGYYVYNDPKLYMGEGDKKRDVESSRAHTLFSLQDYLIGPVAKNGRKLGGKGMDGDNAKARAALRYQLKGLGIIDLTALLGRKGKTNQYQKYRTLEMLIGLEIERRLHQMEKSINSADTDSN